MIPVLTRETHMEALDQCDTGYFTNEDAIITLSNAFQELGLDIRPDDIKTLSIDQLDMHIKWIERTARRTKKYNILENLEFLNLI